MNVINEKSSLVGFVFILMVMAISILAPAADAQQPVGGQNSFLYSSLSKPDDNSVARWIYGLSFGLYIPHNETATYYNGAGEEHSVERALNLYYNRDRLIREIEEILEDFSVYELPGDMKYNPAMQLGFYGGLIFSNSFAVLAEFNYTKLSASGKFTIQTDKETFTSEPYLLLSDIFGTEERIDLRLGFQYTLLTKSYIHPFVESGLNITDTKIVNNRVRIRGININIRDMQTDYYGIRDYGIGFGFYSGLGLKLDVSDQFAIRTGVSVSYSRINLGDNRNIRPQFTAFLRLDLNDVFSKPAP